MVVGVTSEIVAEVFCLNRCYFYILLRDKRDIQIVKEQYFKSTLGHFGVFVVKLHPLLDDAADSRVRVVDELEASDVGATFPQIGQINVQETLRQRCETEISGRKMGRLCARSKLSNCKKKQRLLKSYDTP